MDSGKIQGPSQNANAYYPNNNITTSKNVETAESSYSHPHDLVQLSDEAKNKYRITIEGEGKMPDKIVIQNGTIFSEILSGLKKAFISIFSKN